MTPTAKPRVFSYSRYSTPQQSKGDSTRRQAELAFKWCADRGYTLDDYLKPDLGVSAFKGDNAHAGALGSFLRAIEAGKVPRGSYLLVESLDRISRQGLHKAAGLFLSIVNTGVILVTLADGREYSDKEGGNIGDFIMAAAVLYRAHEESLTKSKRVKAAYQNRRDNIGKRKLTAQAPFWLSLSDDKKTFKVVPESVKIIKDIYKLTIDGLSPNQIAKKFNAEKVPTSRTDNGWSVSTLRHLLTTRAVLGEFQPKKQEEKDGKVTMVPAGEVVTDYFPQVITHAVFAKVQEIMSRRSSGKKTRSDNTIMSLFSGIVKCGKCGGPLHYTGKSKNYNYFVCDNSKRGNGCDAMVIRYQSIETAFLRVAKQVRLEQFADGEDKDSMANQIAILENKKSKNAKKIGILMEAMLENENVKAYSGKISDLETEQEDIAKKIAGLQLQMQSDVRRDNKELRDLVKEMKDLDGDELSMYRLKLRQKIADVVKEMHMKRIIHRAANGRRLQDITNAKVEFKNGGWMVIRCVIQKDPGDEVQVFDGEEVLKHTFKLASN